MTRSSHSDVLVSVAGVSASAQATRQKLIQAGIRCFAELGFNAASTREIEAAAGVTRNLIAHHWGSKEEFWKACAEQLGSAFAKEMALADNQVANVAATDRLRFLIRAFLRASAKFPEVHRIMVDEGKRDDHRLRWLVAHFAQPLKRRIALLLDEARALKQAPPIDPDSFYYMLVGASSMFAMAPECRLLFGTDPADEAVVSRHADAVASLLLRGPTKEITGRQR